MGLGDLPPEILLNIADRLNRKTLKSLRLVSSKFLNTATSTLFSEITIECNNVSIRNAVEIMTNSHLKHLPRSLVISLRPAHDQCQSCGCEDEHPSFEILETILKLSITQHFEQAHSLTVMWDADLFDYDLDPGYMYIRDLHDFTYSICTFINIRQLKLSLKPIINFKLMGISVYDRIQRSNLMQYLKGIQKAMGKLRTLHITGFPDYPWSESAVLDYHGLDKVWLSSSFPVLQSLSLGFGEPWGAIPSFNPSNLLFPVLEKLCLKQYTILHESQVTWITSFLGLKSLVLQGCPIVWIINCEKNADYECNMKSTDWIDLLEHSDAGNSDLGADVYQNTFRWSDLCPIITERLQKLENLTISGVNNASPFLNPEFQDSNISVMLNKSPVHRTKLPRLRRCINPNEDSTRSLYINALGRRDGDDVIWMTPRITDEGLLWEDYILKLAIPDQTFNRIGGISNTNGLCPKEVFTKDYAAIATLFQVVQARKQSKNSIH